MSTYPRDIPKNKHDLKIKQPGLPPPGTSLISKNGFATTGDLFRALDQPLDNKPGTICFVYSYKDGPDIPGPLARELVVLVRFAPVYARFALFSKINLTVVFMITLMVYLFSPLSVSPAF